MIKLIVSYGAALIAYLRSGFSKLLPEKSRQPRLQTQRGQGLVEYALVLVLVAVVIIAILTVLGPQVGGTFFKVECGMKSGITVDGGNESVYEGSMEGEYLCVVGNIDYGAPWPGVVGRYATGGPMAGEFIWYDQSAPQP